MTDDQLIERLRQSLDEVVDASPTSTTMPPAAAAFNGSNGSPRRWLGVAAVTLLLVGGATWAIAQRDREPPGESSQPVPTTETTTGTTTVLPPSNAPEPWYIIISPDVVPGVVLDSSADPTSETIESSTVMAWAATTGPLDGLLVMTFTPPGTSKPGTSKPGTTVPDTTLTVDYERSLGAGTVVRFRGYAMDDARLRLLADQVVAGSGLPFVLPDPSMELLALGGDTAGAQHSQTYSNDLGTMTLTVGDYRGELDDLTRAISVEQVSVAGVTGYNAFMPDHSFHIIWPAGTTGQWARLVVSAELGTIADGRIAAIKSTDSMSPAVSIPPPLAPTP